VSTKNKVIVRKTAADSLLGIIEHTMRFALAFFVMSLFLTSCGRSDVKGQQQLVGTWVADFPDGLRSRCIVRPDGSYSARLDYTDGRVITLEGRLRLEDGVIVDTCTKHSQTNATVPFVTHGYIIHMDSHEIVARWEGSKVDETVMRKVKP
jgi:hypothetical protein